MMRWLFAGWHRMVRRNFLAAGALLLITNVPPAHAANLDVQSGEVLLSRDGAYQSVRGSREVVVGDTLVSRAGSSAKLTFSDGCVTYLGMGMAFTIEAESPCATGRSSAVETGANSSSASNATSSALYDGWIEGTETLAVSQAPQIDFMPYLLGAAAVGGVVVAVSALGGGGGDSPPVSP